MSRMFGNQKLRKAWPGMPPIAAPAGATVPVNAVAPAAVPPIPVVNSGLWVGRNNGSSSSEASGSSDDETDGANNNNENSSSNSSSGSGGGDGSGSSSDESDSDDDGAFMMDQYYREKYMDKLKVIFKAELPGSEHDFLKPPILMRAPTFMPIEPSIYNENSYQSSANEEELKDNESRLSFISKLKTTVRWRETTDGTTGALYKESNSRIVTWSDGSQTFHVGDEAFDVIRHPVSSIQNQLYLGLGNYYRQQCEIKEKLTLRPKLESNFGISHVQGMRKRALNKPANGCVKILTDLTTNPALEREQKRKEEYAKNRKDKRREQQNQRKAIKNQVNAMRHCTADDIEGAQQPSYNATSYNYNPNDVNRSVGLRTNRNTDMVPNYEDLSSDSE